MVMLCEFGLWLATPTDGGTDALNLIWCNDIRLHAFVTLLSIPEFNPLPAPMDFCDAH
jgi:hypothetical protein